MITAQTNADLKDIAARLLAADSVVIGGHISPDGDCIGSQLALFHALKALGKTVGCIVDTDSTIDPTLHFLPGIDEMVPAGSFEGSAEVFLAVDVPTVERLGEDGARIRQSCPFAITVDHHATDEPMSDLNYIDPDVASTTMLAWDLAHLLGAPISSEIAECCYTGLVTDTGRFQYQNTDAPAFEAACQMVAAGADPSGIARQLFQNRTLASTKLEGLAVSRLELLAQGTVAISYLTQSDFEELGASKTDAEPVINALRSLAGVKVACMLREQGNAVRANLRSKDNTDVAAIANTFGGGGHKAAAGFTCEGTLEDTLARVRESLVVAVGESSETHEGVHDVR